VRREIKRPYRRPAGIHQQRLDGRQIDALNVKEEGGTTDESPFSTRVSAEGCVGPVRLLVDPLQL
jgi:hypothetical protein